MNDASSVAAQFQRNPLLACARLQRPAHGGRTGEGEKLEAFVLNQRRGVFTLHGKNAEGLLRVARARHHIGQHQRHHRSLGRWLQHDRASSRQRGCNLVRHQIQRKIKRRDRRTGPSGNRRSSPSRLAPAGMRIQRQQLAIQPRRLFRRILEAECRSLHFAARGADRLACLCRDALRKLFGAPGQLACDLGQCLLALIAASLRVTANALSAAAMACFHMLRPGQRNAPNHTLIKGRSYLQHLRRGKPLPGKIERIDTRARGRVRFDSAHVRLMARHGMQWYTSPAPSEELEIQKAVAGERSPDVRLSHFGMVSEKPCCRPVSRQLWKSASILPKLG